jgi:beta-glucosidase
MPEEWLPRLRPGCHISRGCTYGHLDEAIECGPITKAGIDWAPAHMLTTRFRLGLFDPPEQVHTPRSRRA